MKKTILGLAAIALVSTSTFAQEKAFTPTKFTDNWFIQLQAGASYTFSENHRDASFGDLVSPHAALSIGKYFTPAIGGRLQLSGWESKNYYQDYSLLPGKGTFKVKYLQTNVDGLFNFTNFFMPYEPERLFTLTGIAGLGYLHGFKDTKNGLTTTNMIVPRVGLQADFRLSDMASINLEVVGNLLRDDFNGRREGKSYDGTLNALLGVTFQLSKGGFKTVDALDPSQIDALNKQINDHKAALDRKEAEINKLRQDLANKPEPEVIIQETKVEQKAEEVMNAVVVFRIGSAKLEQNQDINIYNAARFLIDNPNVNVIVTGYADNTTGSATVNQRISEQRAEAVAKVLIDKYNISPNRITTKAAGDTIQLFPTPQWNRVVVFTAVSK
ncbi:OmpA family protein [Dysgonomonas sp. Marseille-P4361]|uniref:OmpA family protein n=1 Tax=Dysgonomonas sp. Marseille-P4361 TaxID=2161820 RepID=UPI000D54F29B|nr:OmpA family protein [Dysgonomonas sp. Marseille-P4361]